MAENKAGPKATFIVVTYVAGARGALKVSDQIQSPSEENARIRAEKLMAAGKVLGVDVIKQIADPEAGEYEEPEYIVRLGRVPELG
jgi:LmbE family N-acetylglucosaminyl deacetylase